MRFAMVTRSSHQRRRLAVVAAAAGLLSAISGGTGPATASPSAWHLLDGFEAADWPDPGLWRPSVDPALSWQPSACEAKAGSRALRAFAAGAEGPAPCDAAVPPGALRTSVMILDLRAGGAASRVDLFFDLWMRLAPGDGAGVFVHLRRPMPDGSVARIPVFGATSQSGVWIFPMRRLDLMNLDDISNPGAPIDLRGGLWELEWSAFAAAGAPSRGGAFVDNVSLVWEPDPAVPTPTVRPTRMPTLTASATPTGTATATRTQSPVPTETPAGRPAYLPMLQDKAFLRPTTTPTATATVTGTLIVTPATTPTPTDTPGKPLPFAVFLPSLGHTAPATPTPTATGTATATAVSSPFPTPTAVPSPPATPTPTLGGRRDPPGDGRLVRRGLSG